MNLFSSLYGLYLWLVVFTGVQSACPAGWLHFRNSCYYFSHESLNWFTAENFCKGHNATLAEPHTREASDFLIHTASNLEDRLVTVPFFLGARDDVIEGIWTWASTDQVMNYSAWAHGEPNGDVKGNCLTMSQTLRWRWGDDNCEARFHFVCEKVYPADSSAVIG